MEHDPQLFAENQMCDGHFCSHRETCARWMMRCDIDRCTLYVIFNKKQWPKDKCPYYLAAPDSRYPAKQ